jgi:TPR repeat protein
VDIHQQCDRCVKGSCALSDADACYHLALKYEAGDEVPQDTNRARALLQKASEAGHAKARQRFRQKWGL